jgi:hypothetical protein
MKSPLILVGLLSVLSVHAGSVMNMDVKSKLTADFLTGFESGLFSRDSSTHFKEYGCPQQHANSAEFAFFKTGIEPIKAFVKTMNNNDFDEILLTIETFVDQFDKFIGVFDTNYKGGDFCAGLTFGMQGTIMLEKIAKTLFDRHIKHRTKEARSHAPDQKQGF